MKFEKIHMPDCTKAFALAKIYGAASGNCIGTVAAWLVAGIAVVGVFIACLLCFAAWGVIKALPVALLAVGRFAKDAISGTNSDPNVERSSMSFGVFGGRNMRRAA